MIKDNTRIGRSYSSRLIKMAVNLKNISEFLVSLLFICFFTIFFCIPFDIINYFNSTVCSSVRIKSSGNNQRRNLHDFDALGAFVFSAVLIRFVNLHLVSFAKLHTRVHNYYRYFHLH